MEHHTKLEAHNVPLDAGLGSRICTTM